MAIPRADKAVSSPPQEVETDCPICLEEMDNKPKLVITACGHAFHETCLTNYIDTSRDCPLCRNTSVPLTRHPDVGDLPEDENSPYIESQVIKLIRRNSESSLTQLMEQLKITASEASDPQAAASAEPEGAWGGVPLAGEKSEPGEIWDEGHIWSAEIKNDDVWTPTLYSQKALLKYYQNPRKNAKSSLVGLAAEYGNREAIIKMVDAGAKIDAPDARGMTPLMVAAEIGDMETCLLLIGLGADINAKNENGVTTALFAAYSGNWPLLETLLDKGADLKAYTKRGLGLMYVAAMNGYTDMLVQLYIRGLDSDVNTTRAANGVTPLLIAAVNGHLVAVEQLLNLGANPELGNHSEGIRPLHIAAGHGNFDMCRILLARKANINARMKNGSTPLIEATRRGDFDMVKFLLEQGADKSLTMRFPLSYSIFPYTAADIAKENGDIHIYDLINNS